MELRSWLSPLYSTAGPGQYLSGAGHLASSRDWLSRDISGLGNDSESAARETPSTAARLSTSCGSGVKQVSAMARSEPRLSAEAVPSVTRKCWKLPLHAGSQRRETWQKKVINNNNRDSFAFHLPFPSQDLKGCSHNNAMKLSPPQAGWDAEAKKD